MQNDEIHSLTGLTYHDGKEACLVKKEFSRLWSESTGLKRKVVGVYALLIGANVAAWVWAFSCFHGYPVLMGTAFWRTRSGCVTRWMRTISRRSTM